MINVETINEVPACILFGQPVRGGQQAAWFTESEMEGARKAKNGKTLACLAPVPPTLEEVVKTLARGRMDNGQVVLAKAAPAVYARLLAAKAEQRKGEAAPTAQAVQVQTAGEAAPAPSGQAVIPVAAATTPAAAAPNDGWEQLKVGDLVIARWGVPDDGWWPARIVKIEGDSFTLAWVAETEPMARRTRAQLALVHPRMA